MSEHIKSARKPRPGEVIGGGAFVFRRGKGTKRIRPSTFPFEHAHVDAAVKEAQKLSAANPGETFIVVAEVGKFFSEAKR